MDKIPLRIAFVALAPFVSGSERCLQLLVKTAVKNGDIPFLILEKGSPLIAWGKEQEVPTYSCYINPLKAPTKLHWLCSQIIITWIIIYNSISVVHSNQIWSYRAIIIPTKITNARKVCHFRDPINNGSKWWLQEPPDLAIFISQYIERQFKSVFGQHYAKNASTCIDPIDLPEEISKEKRELIKYTQRDKLGIAPETFVFGFIGQIAEVKGLAETLYYLSQIKNKDWLLLIAGADPIEGQPYFKKCQGLVSQYNIKDNVRFTGFIENTGNFYHTIDVAILLSKEEPLGLIPMEAAAYYTPSIVSNSGGLPETVIDAETGWIVDSVNEQKIIETLSTVLQSNTKQFGLRARTLVEKMGSLKSYWSALYKKLHSG